LAPGPLSWKQEQKLEAVRYLASTSATAASAWRVRRVGPDGAAVLTLERSTTAATISVRWLASPPLRRRGIVGHPGISPRRQPTSRQNQAFAAEWALCPACHSPLGQRLTPRGHQILYEAGHAASSIAAWWTGSRHAHLQSFMDAKLEAASNPRV